MHSQLQKYSSAIYCLSLLTIFLYKSPNNIFIVGAIDTFEGHAILDQCDQFDMDWPMSYDFTMKVFHQGNVTNSYVPL